MSGAALVARRGAVLLAAALLAAGSAVAQGSEPLRKADLVYLLADPLIPQGEIADVVRRNCLAFRPTERDWADLRTAGAGSEVLANVAACGTRATRPAASAPAATRAPTARPAAAVPTPTPTPTPTPAPEPPLPPQPQPPLEAKPDPGAYRVGSGEASVVRVRVARGDEPQPDIPLVLRGSRSIGLRRDAAATSDDSGYATFPLPGVSLPGAYQFEVVTGSGARLPGRPQVTLTVRPGRPAAVTLEPRAVSFDRPGDSVATFVALVRDSVGNPVPGELTELHLGPGRSMSAATDSTGRARFTLRRGSVPSGEFDVRVRGQPMATLRTARGDAVSEAGTTFLEPPESGAAGSTLPLVFQVRSVAGTPMIDRRVAFRALNATVRPDSAVTNERGEVSLEVQLGERTGAAAVFAVVDSLERVLTVRVQPGAATELRLEYDGRRVDGGRVQVRYGQAFDLKLTAHDAHGNQTGVGPIAHVLRENREQFSARLGLLQLVEVQESERAALLTFKPTQFGRVELTIASGVTATGVSVEVVRRWP